MSSDSDLVSLILQEISENKIKTKEELDQEIKTSLYQVYQNYLDGAGLDSTSVAGAAAWDTELKKIYKEAREALGQTLGISQNGVSDIFRDLGITDSFMQAQMFRNFENDFRDNPPPLSDGSSSSGAGDRAAETGIGDDSSLIGGGGGAFLNSPTIQTDSGINLTSTENLALSKVGKDLLPMLDSFDQSALRSSAVNQFLGGSTPNVVVNIDPSLDAEARIDKQMADINNRLQTGNRFRVL